MRLAARCFIVGGLLAASAPAFAQEAPNRAAVTRPDFSGVWQEMVGQPMQPGTVTVTRQPETLTIAQTNVALRVRVTQGSPAIDTYYLYPESDQNSATTVARVSTVSHWEGDRFVTIIGNLVISNGKESRYESKQTLYLLPDGSLAQDLIRDVAVDGSNPLGRPMTRVYTKVR